MVEPQSGADPQKQIDEFEMQANRGQANILSEFVDFLLHNKKWWLTPIILVLLLVGVLVVLGNSALAPFIYTVF